MNYLSPYFLCLICTGPIMLILGIIMQKWPPKKINNFYGYRTKSSMKSQERWNFAQTYSAKQLIVAGILLILLSIPGLFLSAGILADTFIGTGLLIATLVIAIVRTEKALKKFD